VRASDERECKKWGQVCDHIIITIILVLWNLLYISCYYVSHVFKKLAVRSFHDYYYLESAAACSIIFLCIAGELPIHTRTFSLTH